MTASTGQPEQAASGRRRRRWVRPVVFAVVVVGVIALLTHFVLEAREAGRRSWCNCQLKLLDLAMTNYHDKYGTFPPAYLTDASGRPMHSWRVLILPFLDQQKLYDRYKWDEPWDGPNNIKLLDEMPSVFHCPSHSTATTTAGLGSRRMALLACAGGAPSVHNTRFTSYAVVLGSDCVFTGRQAISIDDVSDGLSNTMMIGEITDAAIYWTQPVDIDIVAHPAIGDRQGFSSDHSIKGANFAFAAGSVRFIPETIKPETLRALFTRNGGEQVGEY